MAFRWIHLSDFHFADTPDPYERNTVLEPLLAEITRRREDDGFQPDALFVTGDIAYSGKPAEYLAATRFFDDLLGAAGLDKSRLFAVPGNHDLDKEKGDGLQRTLNSEKESVGYFAKGKPKYHINKFQAFREWFDGYFQGIRACPNGDTCHQPEIFNVDGLAVAVLPINTALFSLPDKQDHNSLWIGRRNLDAMVKVLGKENPDLTFALLHHPLDWLHDDECSQIETALQKRADFILRGHLHKNKVNLVINTHGDCLYLAAGACYQTRDYPNTALFCTADLKQGQFEVLPIHYVDDPEPKWTLDTSLFDPPDYIGRFPMLKQSRAKERGRVPVISTNVRHGNSDTEDRQTVILNSDVQFDVFLSHNSKDKPVVIDLAIKLQTHGLKVWLDFWELRPGQPWQEALEQIIDTTRAAAVLVGQDGVGPWQSREMRACLNEFVERNLPVIPVLLPGCSKKPALPMFLKAFTWVDLRDGQEEEGVCRLIWGITGKKPTTWSQAIETGQALPRQDDKQDNPSYSPDPELLEMAHKLIVAILEDSDAVTRLLAGQFELVAGTMEVCRDQVAQKAQDTPLPKLFDIALDGQQALLKRKPPDFDGAKVLQRFMQALLPCKHDAKQIGHVRGKLHGGSNSPIEVLASHKTIAEVIMAAADLRPTQFRLGGDELFPEGEGLIAHAEGKLEVGRDPNAVQFERDAMEVLAQKFETRFGKEWVEFTGKRFPNSHSQLTGYQSEAEKKWLAGKISKIVEAHSKHQARQIGQQGSGFTYYFLVNTPDGLGKEEKDKQDAALQRLHSLFPGIAFMRMAPESPHTQDQLDPYLNLHFLLNPNEKPR